MKRLLIAGALAFAATGSVLAADLPQAAPPPQAPAVYVPTVAPVYNWGGIYFGANGGYGFGNSEWSDPNNLAAPNTGNFSTTGFLVGPTVGVNFQTDAFVFGIEGDFDASWLDGKSSSGYCGSGFAGGGSGGALGFGTAAQYETSNSWLGTVRARGLCGRSRAVLRHRRRRLRQHPGWRKWRSGQLDQGRLDGRRRRRGGFRRQLDRPRRVSVCRPGKCHVQHGQSPADWTPQAPPANQTVKFNANLIRLGVDYKFR